MVIKRQNKIAALAFLSLSVVPLVHAITEVDVELQLLLDVSGSVNTSEYDMQLQGYANAFLETDIQSTILDGTNGKIAVQLIMWSGSAQQEVMLDWTLLDSTMALADFSSAILEIARPFSGWTAPGSAIDYSYQTFASNDYQGLKQIIDVSGDGVINSGISADIAGGQALNAGIDTINGIVITSDQAVIDYYHSDVIKGDDAFLMVAENYDAFSEAIAQKILGELSGETPENAIVVAVPEPSAMALLGLAFFMLIIRKRA